MELDLNKFKAAYMVIRAVNHKLRFQMLELLTASPGLTVTKIYVKLGLEQSVASQHLAVLRAGGIVRTQREGKFIHYYVHEENLKEVKAFVELLAAYYHPEIIKSVKQ